MLEIAMIYVTCVLSDTEWRHLDRNARQAFPNQAMSRGEVLRRFSLAGISRLNQMPVHDRAVVSHELELSQQLPDEEPKREG
jgi:hypothetical protein